MAAKSLHIDCHLEDAKVTELLMTMLSTHPDQIMRTKAEKALKILAANESALSLFDKVKSTISIDSRTKDELSPVSHAFLYCNKHTILPDRESKKYVFPEIKKPDVKKLEGKKNQKEKRKYCICQSIYTDGELMLYCDGGCENWYHPKCVGITEEDARRLGNNPNEKWACEKCKQATRTKRKKVA